MPRMIVEITKAEHVDLRDRAREEGVSPAWLASWLLKEGLARLKALPSPEPTEAAA